MSASDPTVLTSNTRFRPIYARAASRSPSRSPMRKAQFAARNLDPLLSNLSPESTLRALQSTDTIAKGGPGQDALTKSISDATEDEREIGIRAAIAAQKYKQWRQEVSLWPWPDKRDRSWGAGFISPSKHSGEGDTPRYLGCLPEETVYDYEERVEEIRDAIEMLDLEEMKDHVFNSHVHTPAGSLPASPVSEKKTSQLAYGRMRDFTALVTATVIQALPDLAKLNMELDAWDVRLSVLRQVGPVLEELRSSAAGIVTARDIVHDPKTGFLVTREEVEITKTILGNQIASLGIRIDRLLDALEGYDDTLPESWIASLEDIEIKYAAWVVSAEHIATQNELAIKELEETKKRGQSAKKIEGDLPVIGPHVAIHPPPNLSPKSTMAEKEERPATPLAELSGETSLPPSPSRGSGLFRDPTHRKPLLSVNPPSDKGHRREISGVSVADSTFSNMSIENAEIADARSTQVMSRPIVSVVDNPFRASREDLSSFDEPGDRGTMVGRPAMVQRASTASIEVIPKESIKRLNVQRSSSFDMLSQIPQSPPSTPSKALRQLVGADTMSSPPRAQFDQGDGAIDDSPTQPSHRQGSSSPHLRQEDSPKLVAIKTIAEDDTSPSLPRRSSKRLTQIHSPTTAPVVDVDGRASPVEEEEPALSTPEKRVAATQPQKLGSETLEDKIKDILITIPASIKLASEEDGAKAGPHFPVTSTESSAPTLGFTLSPVKQNRAGKHESSTGIRLYHLTREGQPKDTPPIKLYVRAVGENGDRVMVRVGGGWADLGEYLKEYSLHHGRRNMTESKLEVANYPGAKSQTPKTATSPNPSFDFGLQQRSDDLRMQGGNWSDSPDPIDATETHSHWIPPPVPPIPTSYAGQNSTLGMGIVSSPGAMEAMPSVHTPPPSNLRSPRIVSSTTSTPNGSTTSTTVYSPTVSSTTYTPLGAGGPKANGRRVVSQGAVQSPANEAWVDGMVGRARVVSNNTTIVHSPTITTTMSSSHRSTPAARRTSTLMSSSPASTPGTNGSPGNVSLQDSMGTVSPTPSQDSTRSRTRMSLSDVSGIKRVFLRRKN